MLRFVTHMQANLPHIQATFCADADSTSSAVHQEMFMLDSGAGGVDVMFHARAMQELQLQRAAGLHSKSIRVKCATGLLCYTVMAFSHDQTYYYPA